MSNKSKGICSSDVYSQLQDTSLHHWAVLYMHNKMNRQLIKAFAENCKMTMGLYKPTKTVGEITKPTIVKNPRFILH